MAETNKTPIRPVQARKWSSLRLAGTAAGLMVAGAAAAAGAKTVPMPGLQGLWLVQAAGVEGGEGGEGGAAAVRADDKADLLVALTKIEAHILTGLDLQAAGQAEAAAEQLGVPKAEIYGTIAAALDSYKAPAFAAALEALSAAGQAGKSAAELAQAHVAVQAGLEAARVAIAPMPKEELAAVLALTREAAQDFSAGVKDGEIAELGEYQDARAYLLAAGETLARLAGSDDAVVKKAAEKSAAALDEVTSALPGVAPEGAVTAEEAQFLAAAAKVELAIYPVR